MTFYDKTAGKVNSCKNGIQGFRDPRVRGKNSCRIFCLSSSLLYIVYWERI